MLRAETVGHANSDAHKIESIELTELHQCSGVSWDGIPGESCGNESRASFCASGSFFSSRARFAARFKLLIRPIILN
jgi:hypothetical protein